MAVPQLASFKIPAIDNEPFVSCKPWQCRPITKTILLFLQKSYAPGSPERAALQAAVAQMEQELPFEVPCIVNGQPVRRSRNRRLLLSSISAYFAFVGQNR